MISEGVNAWNKLVTTEGRFITTVQFLLTHLDAHRKPNLAQVPADREFRELFTASQDTQW